MTEIKHKNFHIIEALDFNKGKRSRQFILDTWRPDSDIWLTGCAIGLLCSMSETMELYLAVSLDDSIGKENDEDYFLNLKKNWLFYQQRDVYAKSTGINDLISYHFLPSGQAFLIKKDTPIHIKVAALNFGDKERHYDAFCNLYYSTSQ